MIRPALLAWGFAISLGILDLQAVAPRQAPAQYMYLDTNGDGIHTDADMVNPSGPTLVDVWLRTDANRDGSPTSCPDPTSTLDLGNSFIFVLGATGGTITWGTFVNERSPGAPCGGRFSSPTEFFCGLCSTEEVPPGLYHLASLSLEVASGTPSLHIRRSSEVSAQGFTAFGSSCPDHTIQLGKHWFDVDGARYGGWLSPPVLEQPSDMTVAEATTTDQNVGATDPDGSTISITKASGPSYLTVETLSSAPGLAASIIRLTPGFADSGAGFAEIQASDGVGTDFRSFGIRVTNVNRAPKLDPIPNICLERGQTHLVGLQAPDPDGDHAAFTAVGLPSFATLSDYGYGYAYLHIAVPIDEGAGLHTMTIFATDGADTDSQLVTLRTGLVGDCSGRRPLRALVYPNPARPNATLSFWTLRRGRLRVTLLDIRGRLVRTLLDQSDAPPANYLVRIMAGLTGSGDYLASGVYLYRIEGADGVSSGRVLILRSQGWSFE